MIPIVTTSQMRSIDELSINRNVITGYSYMNRAGKGLFDVIEEMDLSHESDEIAIVCGKGNNGGDGYVAGRMLIDKGYKVMCYGLCDGESLTGEAKIVYDEYVSKDGNFFHISDTTDMESFCRYKVIIDALLGTGVTGDPRGLYAEIIKLINTSGKFVLSVDTPSGLDNNTGYPSNPVISAGVTVTMGFPKLGQLFYPGRIYTGKLVIKDLGYPVEIVEQETSELFLPRIEDLKHFLPPRKPSGSKFDHGLALIVGGSKGMTGSVSLAAHSALRTGCGMVHCALPESIIPIVSIKVTEPVYHSLKETDEGTPAVNNIGTIKRLAANMQASLIGPGISHNKDTCSLVRKLFSAISIPVVLDADGINAFKGYVETLKYHTGKLIITPHQKEWERLFGILPKEPGEIINTVRQKAKEFSMVVVLKGNPSIIADSEGKVFILPVGNSGMATAGSGDILSGIIVSLIAQGCTPENAAILGVAIHGLSGEKASLEYGEHAMIASDIIQNIHRTIKQLYIGSFYSIFSE